MQSTLQTEVLMGYNGRNFKFPLKCFQKGIFSMQLDRLLRIFIAVAAEGSLTKAGERVHLTHTAVIKSIRKLEDELKTELFRRTSKGVELTEAGIYFLGEARRITADLERVTAHLAQFRKAPVRRTVRLGSSVMYPAAPFLALCDENGMADAWTLEISPIADDTRRFDGLGTDFDFLVCPYDNPIASRAVAFVPTGSYAFCIAVPRGHRLAAAERIRWEDLNGERLRVMLPGVSPINDAIRSELMAGFPGIRIADIPANYSIETFNACAKAGDCLVTLSCWADVHPMLKTIPLEADFRMPYGLVYRTETPLIREFVRQFQGNKKEAE